MNPVCCSNRLPRLHVYSPEFLGVYSYSVSGPMAFLLPEMCTTVKNAFISNVMMEEALYGFYSDRNGVLILQYRY